MGEQTTEATTTATVGTGVLRFVRHQAMLFIFVLLCIIAYALTPDFLSLVNIRNVLRQVSIIGLLAAGETFVIPDPRLRLDQLEVVQQEVGAMLGVGAEAPAAPAPSAEAPAAGAPAEPAAVPACGSGPETGPPP